jgi:hypothetical protein
MNRHPKITMFPTASDDGRELAHGLVELGGELDYEVPCAISYPLRVAPPQYLWMPPVRRVLTAALVVSQAP